MNRWIRNNLWFDLINLIFFRKRYIVLRNGILKGQRINWPFLRLFIVDILIIFNVKISFFDGIVKICWIILSLRFFINKIIWFNLSVKSVILFFRRSLRLFNFRHCSKTKNFKYLIPRMSFGLLNLKHPS